MVKINSTELLESLASEIGDNVYMDIAKWHLYLTDAKLHHLLAERCYSLLIEHNVTEERVLGLLSTIKIQIGGGRKEVPLIDLLPLQCQVHLVDILEKYQQEF